MPTLTDLAGRVEALVAGPPPVVDDGERIVVTCPLCSATVGVTTRDALPQAAGIARAMGVPVEAFTAIRAEQKREAIERDLERHLHDRHSRSELFALLMVAVTMLRGSR